MSEFHQLNSGLIVPVENKPVAHMTREQYMAAHSVCPNCFNANIETTCVGYSASDYGGSFQDTNRAYCSGGWSGIVHELKESK
jgi:hypothetical protein